MKVLLPTAIVFSFYFALIAPTIDLYNRKPIAPNPNPRTELLNKLR
jgi:hypothetical protein